MNRDRAIAIFLIDGSFAYCFTSIKYLTVCLDLSSKTEDTKVNLAEILHTKVTFNHAITKVALMDFEFKKGVYRLINSISL